MPSKEVQVLRELLLADEDYVSGSQLAELVGVSRVSIHSYMEKLRQQGFEFEAIRSKGYRLTKRPESLNEALIQSQLNHASKSLRAIVLDEIDSTNSEAERRLANAETTPFVAIARQQTLGRGRMGRAWHSPKNGNLYASFAFRPEISPSRMALFTLWMGVNICECINAFCRIRAGVKWPNDLHIDGKKVAGILTEARMETDQVRDVVLGLGLNVSGTSDDWPEELRPIAISLEEAAGETFNINNLVSAICGRVMIAYKQFVNDEHKSLLKEKWPKLDTLYNQTVSLQQGESTISGIASGIDGTGALVIENADGGKFLARAGEVTLHKPSLT